MTEVPLKHWLMDEAERRGLSVKTLQNKFCRGELIVPVRRVNSRVIYVQVPNPEGREPLRKQDVSGR